MPRTDWGWEATAAEFESWIVSLDDQLLVVNKPAHLVCHPSKHGPWSSLVGAAKQYLGVEWLHLCSRLDRETTGLVPIARSRSVLKELNGARKVYLAILQCELAGPVTVDEPIGKHPDSLVAARRGVVAGGQEASTRFEPVAAGGGFTLVRVVPDTGRLHQIRVHAAWLGHPVAGDKLYGPDERLFLEFIEHGWTQRHEELLYIDHHALHAAEWTAGGRHFETARPASWGPLLERINLPRQSGLLRPLILR